ncbi:MAG: transglutaminase domain-containing protein, partial [Armatimonadetes bacterium]|nr:transglutaminase domain-containing protein [Armatimonadota bacterium]
MKKILMAIALSLPFVLFGGQKGITGIKEMQELRAVSAPNNGLGMRFGARNRSLHKILFAPEEEVVDSVEIDDFASPLSYIAFEIDPLGRTVTVVPPHYSMDTLCYDAIDLAPSWLRADLLLSLRFLHSSGWDGVFAQMIIDADDNIRDEVAFEIAHMSKQSLTDMRFRDDPYLIVRNAQLIYDIVDSLQYVRLVEHSGDDYYTTTEYRVTDSSGIDTFWTEIPKEIYYWYIVHPKLSDEGVYAADSPSSRQQRTYDYFWRKYLWFNPDATYDYTTGDTLTYLRLGEMMTYPTLLWGRHTADFSPRDSLGNPNPPNNWALATVGMWVSQLLPYPPSGDRGIQPNQLAYNHRGNCGEDQDLLAAASRTALIPDLSVCNIAEDHVWNEFWDNGWTFCQVDRWGNDVHIANSWAGYDRDHGGSKDISSVFGYRGDGYVIQVSERYTSLCTLTVNVADHDGSPVDGAYILVANESYYDSTSLTYCTLAWTDYTGSVDIPLGDRQNYYIRVETSVGSWPSGSGTVNRVVSASIAGEHYTENVNLSGTIPDIAPTALPAPDSARYGIHIEWSAQDYVLGTNILDSQESQFVYANPAGGNATFFLCDSANLYRLGEGISFEAYSVSLPTDTGDIDIYLPSAGKWYAVLANATHIKDYQRIKASCKLIDFVGVKESAGLPGELSLSVSPNPFNSSVKITVPTGAEIEFYDLRGNIVGSRRASTVLAAGTE